VTLDLELDRSARMLVLVEGDSDAEAVRALAERCGLDLTAAGITVVVAGGITNFGPLLATLHERPRRPAVAGLYDAGEERLVIAGLRRAGYGTSLSSEGLDALGFFACIDDLEDEMIRALGAEAVEAVLAAQGELRSFRVFQRQPAQRERPVERQLHRFLGTRSTRKIRYGRLLVDELDLDRVPPPLERLLERLAGTSGGGSS
jgi:Overcoming lysogenization defect protein-like, TOPRIM domain